VLVGLIETVLLIRFLLKALGANADAGFAQVVYGITGVLVAPFGGLFGPWRAPRAAWIQAMLQRRHLDGLYQVHCPPQPGQPLVTELQW